MTKLYPIERQKTIPPARPSLIPIHIGLSEKVLEWAKDEENAEYFRRYAPVFAMRFDFGDPNCWAVYIDGSPVGLACLTDIDPGARKAAMGFLLEKPFRNSTIVTNTCREVMRYVFEYLGYNKLYTLTLPHRIGLHARLEAGGFTREATLSANCFWRGRYWDEVQHSILKSQYDTLYLEK